MTGKKKVNDFNYINRVMGYQEDVSNNKLICITNGKEVLRITFGKAKEFFFEKVYVNDETLEEMKSKGYEVEFGSKKDKGYYFKPKKEWFFTTKKVYKQYVESLKPGSKIPAPTFSYKDKKDSVKPKNVFI